MLEGGGGRWERRGMESQWHVKPDQEIEAEKSGQRTHIDGRPSAFTKVLPSYFIHHTVQTYNPSFPFLIVQQNPYSSKSLTKRVCTLNTGAFLFLTKIDDDEGALAQNTCPRVSLPEGAAVVADHGNGRRRGTQEAPASASQMSNCSWETVLGECGHHQHFRPQEPLWHLREEKPGSPQLLHRSEAPRSH